eukprot:Nk52_evm13s240 gene=Nk52_evmTU13s240
MVISRDRLELLNAAENDDHQRVKAILMGNPYLINVADQDGYTALHRASYNGLFDMILLLLSNGARPDSRTNDGWEPIHCACRWGYLDCAELLVQAGCGVNDQTNGGQTPLHLAVQHGHVDIVRFLLLRHDSDILIKNKQGESAYDLSQRHETFAPLFEALDYTRMKKEKKKA